MLHGHGRPCDLDAQLAKRSYTSVACKSGRKAQLKRNNCRQRSTRLSYHDIALPVVRAHGRDDGIPSIRGRQRVENQSVRHFPCKAIARSCEIAGFNTNDFHPAKRKLLSPTQTLFTEPLTSLTQTACLDLLLHSTSSFLPDLTFSSRTTHAAKMSWQGRVFRSFLQLRSLTLSCISELTSYCTCVAYVDSRYITARNHHNFTRNRADH